MGRDARQSSADEARNLLAAADNVVSLGIRRPQEGEAHAKEAVLSRPTPDTKLGLTLTDLGDGQVVIHQARRTTRSPQPAAWLQRFPLVPPACWPRGRPVS